MLARVMTLRFDPALEAFDDGPLQEFLKAEEPMGSGNTSYSGAGCRTLLCLPHTSCDLLRHQRNTRRRRSYLSDAELPLLNALRHWHAKRARHPTLPGLHKHETDPPLPIRA